MLSKRPYTTQEKFELAKGMLRSYLGLELCLSEQVILRKIVEVVEAERLKIKYPQNGFLTTRESIFRFLMQEYGITLADKIFSEPFINRYYSEKASLSINFMESQRNLL